MARKKTKRPPARRNTRKDTSSATDRNLMAKMPDPPSFPKSIDYTRDGECSRCGACCSSMLPTTQAERKTLARYARKHGIAPEIPEGDDIIYMQCPLLDQASNTCLAYQARPAICRAYRCDRSSMACAAEYMALTGRRDTPDDFNSWEIFGKTGLRAHGIEITPENAPQATLTDDLGIQHEIQVGRPIRNIIMADGKIFTHVACIDIGPSELTVFDGTDVLKRLAYADIKAIR